MKNNLCGSAGFVSKDDAKVTVEIDNKGRVVELNSKVSKLFGEQIKASINEVLDDLKIESAHVIVEDKGALDFVLKARTEVAVKRALACEEEGDEK